MAGMGSRFKNAGYSLPKPLIKVNDKPMIEVVINNIRPKSPYKFIFICLKEHINLYRIDEFLLGLEPGSEVVVLKQLTDGAARTVLQAESLINNDNPLMIANCDQYIDVDINNYLDLYQRNDLDGFLMTMHASDNKWSFVKLDKYEYVTQVVEKEIISNEATVGIYNFSRGSDFVLGAHSMIKSNKLVNGEFYVAPVYQELINLGKKFATYNLEKKKGRMHGIGTPEDLELFLKSTLGDK